MGKKEMPAYRVIKFADGTYDYILLDHVANIEVDESRDTRVSETLSITGKACDIYIANVSSGVPITVRWNYTFPLIEIPAPGDYIIVDVPGTPMLAWRVIDIQRARFTLTGMGVFSAEVTFYSVPADASKLTSPSQKISSNHTELSITPGIDLGAINFDEINYDVDTRLQIIEGLNKTIVRHQTPQISVSVSGIANYLSGFYNEPAPFEVNFFAIWNPPTPVSLSDGSTINGIQLNINGKVFGLPQFRYEDERGTIRVTMRGPGHITLAPTT